MVSVIISGIIMGMLYALAGLGLVVVYRTSKVLNFAMGGIGALVAYAASDGLQLGLPYWVVLPVGILFGALLGGLVQTAVARPLRKRPHLTISLGTLGVLLIFEGVAGLRYGYAPQSISPAFSSGGGFTMGSVSVSTNQLFIAAVGVAATILLLVIIRKTRLGLSMRAVSSGPHTAELLGVNIGRVRLSSWMLGGAYGGLAAVLVTPLTFLSPHSFTTFLLTAFGAVVLGGFTSIAGVVVGALFFGVASNLLLSYLDPSLISTYTFIGVALVLFLRPNGIFGKRERDISEPHLPNNRFASSRFRLARLPVAVASEPLPPARPITGRTRMMLWLVAAGLFGLVPFFATGQTVFLLATVFATFIGVLGLNVLAGFSGQVSLGHSAFLAIGAYTTAIATSHGMPLLPALLLAGIVGGIAGFLLGLPATRLSGIYLTVLTLIFAFALPELILFLAPLTGGASGLPVPLPDFLNDDIMLYWLVFIIAIVIGIGVFLLGRSRLGRSWRAVRDSPDGARSLGLNPAVVKLTAFSLGSGLAALSGALSGMLVGFVGPDSFGVLVSIYALLAVVLGGVGSIPGSLLGAFFITLVPTVTGQLGIPQDLVFGVALLLVLYFAPRGLAELFAAVPGAVRRGTAVLRRRSTVPNPPTVPAMPSASTPVTGPAGERNVRHNAPPVDGALLELRDVSAGYSLEPVLREIDVSIAPGEILALLGANGAGKSTLLRVVSGVLPAITGSVAWRGQTLEDTTASTYRRARMGIAHVPEGRGIFPDLSVRENLMMGTFGSRVTSHSSADHAEFDRVFLHFPLLRDRLGQQAGTLSGGQQQMLAIGRALVSRPALLMLDEPSLGLSPLISQQVFGILRDIADTGVSILLVEQNARASLALADRACVLSRGRIVLSGTAAELASDELLRSTYLEVN